MVEGYDTAQICLNGHVVNEAARGFPQFSANFCKKCGAPTIIQCENCKMDIRGSYTGSIRYSRPSFCHACGKPYPWIEAKLKAAQELSDELENLTEEEKGILKRSLDDIIRDTPLTTVAATRFKRLAVKAGKGAAEGLKDILVDILSETAKKIIWPSSP